MVYGLTDFGRDVTRIEARQDFQQDKDRLVGLHIPDKLASIRIGGKNDRGRRQRFCFPGDPHDLQTVFRDLPVVSDRNAAEARHRRFIDNRVEAPLHGADVALAHRPGTADAGVRIKTDNFHLLAAAVGIPNRTPAKDQFLAGGHAFDPQCQVELPLR